MRVAISTFGCRLNQFDSDALERLLERAGHEVVAAGAQADVHVINTCTITHAADADVRKLARRSVRRHPKTPLVVTGCYANAEPHKASELPGVRLVLGNADKARLPDVLAAWENAGHSAAGAPHAAAGRESSSARTDAAADTSPLNPAGQPRTSQQFARGANLLDAHRAANARVAVSRFAKRPEFDVALRAAPAPRRTRAYLKVQDGCNYRCAFCIVPHVRGNSRSLPPEQVVEQLQELVHAGMPEVVLTGVHLGTYGRDLAGKPPFSTLVETLLAHLGAARLRLSSLDPHEVDTKLIGLFRHQPDKLCRHLHLPTQSGHTPLLRRMRRGHTAEDFERLVSRLAAEHPHMAMGTDLIVGHPGESEASFAATYDLMARLPIAYLHVFSYSPRDNTAAAEMPDQVPEAAKRQRSAAMRALSKAKQRAFAEHCQTRPQPALVLQQRDPSKPARALTDNYLHVELVDPPKDMTPWVGTWHYVQLEDVTDNGRIYGRLTA